MPLPPDEFDYAQALSACASGDRSALQRLYEQESPRLLGMLLRLVRDRGLAEDLLHDAWMRLWQQAARFDPARGSARGWIYTLTRNLALSALRDGLRERHSDLQDWPEDLAEEDGGDRLLDGERIEHCLQGLDPQRRACLLHAYLDGYSHAQIAARMDTPLGTVKAWIKRSLTALRECLG